MPTGEEAALAPPGSPTRFTAALTQGLPGTPTRVFHMCHEPGAGGWPAPWRVARGSPSTGPQGKNRGHGAGAQRLLRDPARGRGPNKCVMKQNEVSQAASRSALPEPQLWACGGPSLRHTGPPTACPVLTGQWGTPETHK